MLTLVDGEEIEYHMENDSVSIGRSSKCDLVIPHESMSRQHCKIEFKDSEIFITDLGSINGVYIDGKKIPPNSSVPFHTYLHLAFGFVTSAQLMVDEKTRLGILNPSFKGSKSSSSSPSNATNPGTKTKTKVVAQKVDNSPKEKQKASQKSEKNATMVKGIAFVGVMLALYYFLYAGKETTSTTINSGAPQAAPKPTDTNDHF
jgi:pSer/pThr/pTyr-binding forkhead associated (FHA) protein